MINQDIIDQARNKYNATGDNFWSDDELIKLIYFACMELAIESRCIERKYTVNTVIGIREYNLPTTGTIAVKRITYNGCPLAQIDFQDDDVITGNKEDTTNTGTPMFYQIWQDTVMLRPAPAEVGEVKIYTYNQPQEIELDAELEIPTRFHPWIVDYIVGEMFAKEKDFSGALFYQNRWLKNLQEAKKWKKRQLYQNAYPVVKSDELVNVSILGMI